MSCRKASSYKTHIAKSTHPKDKPCAHHERDLTLTLTLTLNLTLPLPLPLPHRLQARHALGGEGGEAAAAAELQALYAAHGVSPMRMLALPLVQLPLFLSFFVGLKRCSSPTPNPLPNTIPIPQPHPNPRPHPNPKQAVRGLPQRTRGRRLLVRRPRPRRTLNLTPTLTQP